MIAISGKLNKAATTFDAKEYVGFNVGIGKQFYNRETKAKEWTNYRGVIFAKTGSNQAQFYTDTLVEGAIIMLSGSNVQIKEYNGAGYLEIIDCKVDIVSTPDSKAPQSQGFNQPKAVAPPKQTQGFDDFDDDIPF